MKQKLSLVLLGAALSTGCALETAPETTLGQADEAVADVEQAFTEAACPTLTPDAFLTVTGRHQSALARTTGATYGTPSCTKAYKVNVRIGAALTGSVYVFWQAPFPNTQTTCVNAKAFLRLYEKVGANYVLRAATSAIPKWTGTSCTGLFAWSDQMNIGNGNDWMAIGQGVGSDNKLRPLDVLLVSH